MNTIDLISEQQNFLSNLEKAGKSFNTVKNYRTDLNCFNKFLAQKGRKLLLEELTTTQVKEYCTHLEKTYNSPNSVRRRIQALRIFYDYLLEKGSVDSNPIKKAVVAAKVVEIPKPTTFKNIQTIHQYFFKQSQSEKSLEALLGLRNLVLFNLIYGAGLKVSDISILGSNHIQKNNNDEYRVLVSHPKRDPYTVKLPLSFNKIYECYQEALIKQKDINDISFDNLLFNANPYRILAGGLSPRGIEILFKDLSEKLNFKVTAKSLRQSCIFKWLIKGEPQSTIKEWMGVQPQYSLRPYLEELEKHTEIYTFIDIGELH
jgi:site-specific recombinase XerD